jgi:hypothetical protein
VKKKISRIGERPTFWELLNALWMAEEELEKRRKKKRTAKRISSRARRRHSRIKALYR